VKQPRSQAVLLAQAALIVLPVAVLYDLRSDEAAIQAEVKDGRVVYPPDYPAVPEPAAWVKQIPAGQARLWAVADEALYKKKDNRAARVALASLASSGSPAAARSVAEYRLLMLDSGRADAQVVRRSLDLAGKSK